MGSLPFEDGLGREAVVRRAPCLHASVQGGMGSVFTVSVRAVFISFSLFLLCV